MSPGCDHGSGGGVLVGDELRARIHESDFGRRLFIVPILADWQIQQSGVDLRLGNQFIVTRNARIGAIDPSQDSAEVKMAVLKYQERVIVPFFSGEAFVLHPGQLVLGSTFEYVCLPDDVEARIDGRSSFARLGLTIAGAVSIAPGFKGVITLELANHHHTPLVLFPGWPIAQLVLSETKGSAPYKGKKYVCPIGPQFSRLSTDASDKSLRMWSEPVSLHVAPQGHGAVSPSPDRPEPADDESLGTANSP